METWRVRRQASGLMVPQLEEHDLLDILLEDSP
jgi:hypothetical protein